MCRNQVGIEMHYNMKRDTYLFLERREAKEHQHLMLFENFLKDSS